jgi:protein pelota
MTFTIRKEWKGHELKRLHDATRKHPKMAVVAVDDEGATIAKIHAYGVEEVATILSHRPGKMYAQHYDERSYLAEVLGHVQTMDLPVAIVGPGFEKDRLADLARERLGRYVVDTVAHAGMPGVYEALKRGIVERIVKENRVSQETRLVENLIAGIARGNLVAYGKEEVTAALRAGAAETVLVLAGMVRETEDLVEMAENVRADVELINEWHDAGRKLAALGGVAAFLRFPITPR